MITIRKLRKWTLAAAMSGTLGTFGVAGAGPAFADQTIDFGPFGSAGNVISGSITFGPNDFNTTSNESYNIGPFSGTNEGTSTATFNANGISDGFQDGSVNSYNFGAFGSGEFGNAQAGSADLGVNGGAFDYSDSSAASVGFPDGIGGADWHNTETIQGDLGPGGGALQFTDTFGGNIDLFGTDIPFSESYSFAI